MFSMTVPYLGFLVPSFVLEFKAFRGSFVLQTCHPKNYASTRVQPGFRHTERFSCFAFLNLKPEGEKDQTLSA